MNNSLGCTHYGRCAGCAFEHQLDRFPLVEEARSFYKTLGLDAPIHFFGAHEWRTRAKLAVRGSLEFPEIGLFEKRSHHVLPIPHCRVHHPSINAAVSSILAWMKDQKIPPYNEITEEGVLRYIQCTVERSTGKIQLALVCNEKIAFESVQLLWDSAPMWHSIWENRNSRRDNVIFGDRWNLLFGQEWLWEELAGVQCCFHPAGFAQANLTAYEAVLKRIAELVPPESRVIEYYAGAGGIGLSLAAKGYDVRCFESNQSCESAFLMAKEGLSQENISWTCSSTENALEHIESCDVIIVDPPRKGLDAKTLQALGAVRTNKKLIYVSCGWESCRRNIDALVESGWKLTLGEIYLFFPGSDHIETLQVLTKADKFALEKN